MITSMFDSEDEARNFYQTIEIPELSDLDIIGVREVTLQVLNLLEDDHGRENRLFWSALEKQTADIIKERGIAPLPQPKPGQPVTDLFWSVAYLNDLENTQKKLCNEVLRYFSEDELNLLLDELLEHNSEARLTIQAVCTELDIRKLGVTQKVFGDKKKPKFIISGRYQELREIFGTLKIEEMSGPEVLKLVNSAEIAMSFAKESGTDEKEAAFWENVWQKITARLKELKFEVIIYNNYPQYVAETFASCHDEAKTESLTREVVLSIFPSSMLEEVRDELLENYYPYIEEYGNDLYALMNKILDNEISARGL